MKYGWMVGLICTLLGNNVLAFNNGAAIMPVVRPNGLQFTQNKGQVVDANNSLRANVLYTGEMGGGAKVFMFKNAFSYVFSKREVAGTVQDDWNDGLGRGIKDPMKQATAISVQRIDVEFVGANTGGLVTDLAAKNASHFYYAHCPNGISASSFQQVTYKNLYAGIDAVFKGGNEGGMEYDFVLQPGADVSVIKMRYTGANDITLQGQTLVVKTITGELKEIIPQVYQLVSGIKTEVKGAYVLNKVNEGEWIVGFAVPAYDRTKPLVIDPWVTYITSTTSGHNTTSDNSSYAQGVCVDPFGDIVVEGYTNSPNFPVTAGVFQTTNAGPVYSTDIFVAKFDTLGNRLWATYYGGTNYEIVYPRGVATDRQGNIAINAAIRSNDFPVTGGAFQGAFGGGLYDGAIVKLAPDGTRIWATYYGGSNDELAMGLTIDASDNIIATGGTKSTNFPVSIGAFQATNRSSQYYNGYILKLSPVGAALWSTYFGGSVSDLGQGIATDKNNNVILAGTSVSTDYPVTSGAYQTTNNGPTGLGYGSGDMVFAKFDSAGNRLWATYYGSTGQDGAVDVVTDTVGDIYMVGTTYYSTTFPTTPGVLKPVSESTGDVIVVKFSSSGARVWATALGGTRQDIGYAIALGEDGYIYLCGQTTDDVASGSNPTNDFPVTSCAYQSTPASNGFGWWFSKMNPSATALCYSSYLDGESTGGGYSEHTSDLAYAHNTFYIVGYVTGNTVSPSNFPVTPGAFQTTPSGSFNNDGLLAAISIPQRKPGFSAANPAVCAGGTVDFNRTLVQSCSTVPGTGIISSWSFPGGTPPTSTDISPSGIVYTDTGTYDVLLVVTTPCGIDSVLKKGYIQVASSASATVTALPASVCTGDSAMLTVAGNVNFIQWQSSIDSILFTDIDNATGYSYTALSIAQSTYFRVFAESDCGTGFSNVQLVNVNAAGAVAGTIAATPDSVCEGSIAQLTATGSNGPVHWQSGLSPNTLADINGANSTTYTTPALTQTTYYRLIAGTANCTDTSQPLSIVVNPVPVVPVLTLTDTIICSGDSAQVCAPVGYSSYLWNNAATTACIQAKNAGGYWVTVSNTSGCTNVSERSSMAVYPVPSVSIIVQGDTLTSFGAVAYQWYHNDEFITGATSSIYVVDEPGYYSVQITDANGCKTSSSPVYAGATGINPLAGSGLYIYPNPFTHAIYINAVAAGVSISRVQLYDVLGREVFSQSFTNTISFPVKIDVAVLPAGAYYLVAKTNKGDVQQKLIKP